MQLRSYVNFLFHKRLVKLHLTYTFRFLYCDHVSSCPPLPDHLSPFPRRLVCNFGNKITLKLSCIPPLSTSCNRAPADGCRRMHTCCLRPENTQSVCVMFWPEGMCAFPPLIVEVFF